MPRPAKGPRLYLKTTAAGRVWIIRDGERRVSTGRPEGDRGGAEKALASYIAKKHTPNFGEGDPSQVSVLDVLCLYSEKRAPETARPEMIAGAVVPLGEFWTGKKVSDISPITCSAYVKWRCGQPQGRYKIRKGRTEADLPRVGRQTARRELETLSAALGFAYRARKLNYVVPVELPTKSLPRERWLTRGEVARFAWAAWRAPQGKSKHLARLILLGVYTGTRKRAMQALRWLPSTDSGWVDLDRAVVYRKGSEEAQTTKRRTPVPISGRLLAHLRRWRRLSNGANVIEYEVRSKDQDGREIIESFPIADNFRRSWERARVAAGLDDKVTPHTLRHTFATWAVQDGVPFGKVAGALGTTERMVEQVYGHHAPEHLRDVVETVAGRREKVSAPVSALKTNAGAKNARKPL